MSITTKNLTCEACGEYLRNTAGGNYATCPKLCGKLKPKLSDADLKMIEMQKAHAAGIFVTDPPERVGRRLIYKVGGGGRLRASRNNNYASEVHGERNHCRVSA